MPLTITLVQQRANWLRYKIIADGVGPTGTIPCAGGASPDLLTDTLPGPLRALAKVVTDGLGPFAAGVQTQAKARALWLSNWAGVGPGIVDNGKITTAKIRATLRAGAGTGAAFEIDADVDVSGNPELNIACANDGGGCDWYLDIEIPEAID